MKQTAVEWLFLMLNNPNKDQEFTHKLLEQAKEMEKEQIIDAHNCGYSEGIYQSCELGEEYYNETFKSE